MARRSWLSVHDVEDLSRAAAAAAAHDAPADPSVDVDCAKLARQLRHSARTTVGLLPTGDGADVQAFATELGFAIALLTEKTSVVLDPEQRSGAPTDEGETLFYAHVPARLVVTLVPLERAPVGAKFEVVKLLNQIIMRDRHAVGQVLVDLSGLRLPGELLGAISLLDGIIVVGPAGEATEKDLLETVKLVPPRMNLGVVLTRAGAKPKRRAASA